MPRIGRNPPQRTPPTTDDGSVGRGTRWLRSCWLVAWLTLAGFLAYTGIGGWPADPPAIDVTPVTAAATERTAAIQKIQVGQRVVGRNPIRAEVESWTPDPATWQRLDLHMAKEHGGSLWITLLRPAWWVESKGAQVGGTIELELAEMGAWGPAEVQRIGPCPAIASGARHPVVTGTFRHETGPDSRVISLRLESQSEATRVTDNHPYWSVDREAFVAAGELRAGETVDTMRGPSRVASAEPFAYTGILYNLETTEHVYRVGSQGTLVHNTCPGGNTGGSGSSPKPQYGETPGGRPLTKHYAEDTGPQRNIPGSVVDNTIDKVPGVPAGGGKTVHYDPENNITVVTGDGQSIVSAHKGQPRAGQH